MKQPKIKLFFKFLLVILSFSLIITEVSAAYFENMPTVVKNPDGTEIHCLLSGDEFFNYLHDENGFTIIQGGDGFFYYGINAGDIVVPSKYQVNSVSPEEVGIKPHAVISLKEYSRRVELFWEGTPKNVTKAPHTGQMSNIVVYIRFSDDTEFPGARSTFDNRLNNPSGPSLIHYFQEVSYDQLTIESHHFPICELTTNLSYQDINPRSYYQPYNASTNPNGYSGDYQRRIREHQLLQRAVEAIESEVPTSLVIDGDSDGYVDAVSFIIRGNAEGWSDLLWAHRWSLYTYDVRIHGKRVWDYTFQPQNQTGTSTLVHEMFHVLGAPDLYRYNYDGTPVGPWDLMASGFVHMGAHMKYKYANGNWINEIPTISEIGEYTLNPLTSSENNAFRINSPYTDGEYFVVEYRKKEGLYEVNLPNEGLLVYRINLAAGNGNAQGPPDEVYIYRPGGTPTTNGNINNAPLSLNSGNTSINDYTDPSSFLSNGSFGGLNITNVTEIGETISFTLSDAGVYIINLSSNPPEGGIAIDQTSQSPYNEGAEVTLQATPNYGYDFVNWTDDEDNVVSEESVFVFTMPNHNVDLVANFIEKSIQNVNFTVTNQHDQSVSGALIAVMPNDSKRFESILAPITNQDIKQNEDVNESGLSLSTVHADIEMAVEELNSFKLEELGEWLHWDNGVNNTGIGTGGAAQFSIASRWEPEDLELYDGLFLSRISFFPRVETCLYTIKIWMGTNATEVYSQPVINPAIGEWNLVDLDIPLLINAENELWFGIEINTQTGHPAGADVGPAIVEKGDMFKFSGNQWVSIYNAYGLNINWNLQAFVSESIVKQTDDQGQASFNLVEGDYTFSIHKYNYEPFDSTLSITDANLEVNITLTQMPTYSVTFVVADEDENPIEGASVYFEGDEYTTSAEGTVVIEDLDPWTYQYEVNKEGFIGVSDEVEIIDADVIENVTLILIPTYTVTFSVVDSDVAIEGATVTFNTQNYTTDSDGLVIIEGIYAGNYPYSVVKTGYFDASGVVNVVDEDVNKTVTLIPHFKVTFTVTDVEGPVAGATINFNSQNYTTNSQGIVEITEVGSDTYPYTVTKQGYKDATGEVVVIDADIEEEVTLVRIYTVTINVEDSQGVLSDATVTFNDDEYTTDSDGIVEINQVESGLYPYTVSKDDYHEVSGEIEVVNADVEITISLIPVGINNVESAALTIYPNPFSNKLNLTNLKNVETITITNVIGQTIIHLPVSNENMEINTSSLPSGVYLISLQLTNNQREIRKIIKN